MLFFFISDMIYRDDASLAGPNASQRVSIIVFSTSP